MTLRPRWMVFAILAAGAPVLTEDCNRNGIEDRVEIETPAIDFRLADELDVAFAGSLAAVDFDGDGDEDLAVDAFSEGGLVLLRNEGAGRLARAGSLDLPLHHQPIGSADLDGDRDLDLVLLLDFDVQILWNDSDGSFSDSTLLPVGSGPRAVEAADIDLDQDMDLITANSTRGIQDVQNVSVLVNQGERTFGLARNFASVKGHPVLCVADPDGDGDIDALVGSFEKGDVRLLENEGAGGFRQGPAQSLARFGFTCLVPADVDADGRDEVLALGRWTPRPLLIISRTGGGQLEVDGEMSVPGQPEAILARDVTGDGNVDIIIPSGCPAITVIEGPPERAGDPRSIWLGMVSQFLILAELDGDGLPDLAGIGLGDKVFTLLEERSTLSRDCNRNGVPDGCEPDCDRNRVPDDCDLRSGTPDCDSNGVPDACDPDCDASGTPDACDIGAGRADDCNANGVPDGCEPSVDADGNRIPDACDIARDPALDCDGNGKLDVEDLEPRARFVQEEHELGGWPWSACLADMDGDADSDIVAGIEEEGLSILEQLDDGSFARPRTYRVDTLVRAVQALDADSDGDMDLAIGTPEPECPDSRGWVSLRLNHGSFRFGSGPAYELERTLEFLEAEDLDGDGILDLIGTLVPPFETSSPLWALAGRGDGTFAQPFEIAAETSGPFACADLDGNGKQDIATGRAVFINQGGWTFVEAPLDVGGHQVAAGDIDGDSDADLVVGERRGEGVHVLANDGRARFSPIESRVSGGMTGTFTLGDFDADGRADIAATTRSLPSDVALFMSQGSDFVEAPAAAPLGVAPSRLFARDMDGDGLDDVVALVRDARSAIVLVNPGSGALSSRTGFAQDQAIVAAEIADLDQDLDLDLAALVSDPLGAGTSIGFFRNDGNASYALETLLDQDHDPRIVRLADVSGDGRPDLILEEDRGEAGTSFSVLRNDGAWSFALEHNGPAGPHVEDLALADFDLDGDLDVARLRPWPGEISVVLNDGGGRWREPITTLTGIHSVRLPVANADGDGLPDLFAAGIDAVWVHRGAGAGGFQTPAQVLSFPAEVHSAAAADIGADGNDDLVVGRTVTDCEPFHPNCWRLEAFLNARGVLVPSEDHGLDGPIHRLLPADIDGDGDLDILAGISADLGSSATHIRLFTTSGGGLRRGVRITMGGGLALWFDARDLDGDGDADVIFSPGVGFSVLRNDTPPPVLRDANRDGVPDACERAPFRRGEADQDGALGLSDAVAILGVLFQGVPLPACPAALDADDSGGLDITDPIRILGHLFLGQGPLPEPFAACGADPTPDALACSEFRPCA